MLKIDSKARARVSKVAERKERMTIVHLSSSRKDNQSDEFKYSDWGFSKFVGKAHSDMESIGEGDILVLTNAMLTKEPYEKDGETVRPKSPILTVFEFEVYRSVNGNATSKPKKQATIATLPPEDDIPF